MVCFKDLKARVLVSAFFVLWAFLLVYFSKAWFMPAVVIFSVCTLSSLGLFEFVGLCKKKKLDPNPYLMIFIGVGLNLFFFFSLQFPQLEKLFPGLIFAVIVLATFFRYKKIDQALPSTAVELLGIIYVALPLAMIIKILYSSSHSLDGRIWVAYLMLVTKMTDVGAYFGGRLFGKAKLCPVLSPKKTIEGALTGLLFGVGMSYLFFYLCSLYTAFELCSFEALILGGVLSVAGQLGDLSESLFKRDASVKDSNTLPGLGGVLDLFDSVFFTVPVLYYYLLYF